MWRCNAPPFWQPSLEILKWAEQFPGHVAAAWLGHTEEIADAHYRQVLPDHFERAMIATTTTETVHGAVQSTVHETVPHRVTVLRTDLQTPQNHLSACELAHEKSGHMRKHATANLGGGGNRTPVL